VFLAGVSLCLGCASFPVGTDYDPATDFGSLRTFGWAPIEPTIFGTDHLLSSDLLHARVSRAIEAELKAKGMGQQAEGADFWVTYHVGLEHEIDVDTIYRTGPYGRSWTETQVREYDQGTLLVDVLLPGSGRLVWRGSVQARVHERSTPQERDERIRAAVAAVLEKFPPGPS
jgi:hypothetical protein